MNPIDTRRTRDLAKDVVMKLASENTTCELSDAAEFLALDATALADSHDALSAEVSRLRAVLDRAIKTLAMRFDMPGTGPWPSGHQGEV